MSQPPPLDSVSVLTTLAGALVGEQMAPAIGTYGVMLLGFVGGAVIGVLRRDPESRVSAFAFVMAMFFITAAITVFLAEYLSDKTEISVGALEAAISIFIPAVGEDWLKLIKTIIDWGFEKVRNKFGGQS